MLALEQYRSLVGLDRPFAPLRNAEARPALIRRLIDQLIEDGTTAPSGLEPRALTAMRDVERQRRALRALLTTRRAVPLSEDFHAAMDGLLQQEREARPTVDVRSLPVTKAGIALWQGDITTLAADAIVNAANEQLLGCFQPFHACIDNAIHAAAGPRLREDCARLMAAQGHPEPTGAAKATRGYNLPARYVLHTVGPIVERTVGPEHEGALAASYRACLDLALAIGDVRTVVFCCISTGVFGFPKGPAARIALRTVDGWLRDHAGALDRVVFNVFGDEDREIYAALLQEAGER
jgi:O-acetyl-ADP-ribose deacetylase (regulator of RNase III)